MSVPGTSHSSTFDTLLELQDAAEGAVTATAIGQVGGADKILDLGAANPSDAEAAEFKGTVVIDVTALAIDGNDEVYDFILQGSTKFDFADTIENLASTELGALEVRAGSGDIDSIVGRYLMPVQNWVAGTIYRYLRLECVHVGATTSITYTARLGK